MAGSSHVLPLASVSTCTGISSNINSILTCSGSANTLIITITSISSSEISAGSTVLFSIADLFSPPTCESIDIITVTTCDSALNQIDQSQGTISGLIPQQLTDFSLRSSLSKLVVNNFLGGLNISFTLTDTLSNKDYFVITFPSNVTVDYSNKQSSFIIATVSYNSTANTLTFTQTSTSANYNVGTAGYLLFIKFKAPPSIRPTAPITFAVVNNNASRMVGTATITASPNTYSLAVSTTGQQISQFASYSFTVNTTDALTATGVIVITLPAEFSLVAPQLATLATNLTASVTGRNINTIPTVRTSISPSNANQYIITLSNLNASSSIPGQSLTIIINNLLNPYYVCTVTSFTVSTYYTNNVAIDLVANAVSTTSITYTPGTITSLSATSTSLMTYSSTTVSVTFTTKSPLFSGCFIILVLPTKLLVSTSTPSSCSLTVNSNPIILPPSSYTFNIVNNSITVALSSTISANSIVILSFTIISPESTAVTGTFSVSTVGPTLTLIDQSNAIATLQMTKGNPFASISVTRSSAKNS